MIELTESAVKAHNYLIRQQAIEEIDSLERKIDRLHERIHRDGEVQVEYLKAKLQQHQEMRANMIQLAKGISDQGTLIPAGQGTLMKPR